MVKTTQQIAKEQISNYSKEIELNKKAKEAMNKTQELQLQPKLFLQSKYIPNINSKVTNDNLKDYRINIKLDDIGTFARLTDTQKANMQSLPTNENEYLKRKQQIDLQSLGSKLLQNSGLNEPFIYQIPKSDDEWELEGNQYKTGTLKDELNILRNKINTIVNNYNKDDLKRIQLLKEGKNTAVINHALKLTSDSLTPLIYQKEQLELAIKNINENGRKFTENIKQLNNIEMDNFNNENSILNTLGVNLQRFPNETDEEYQNRIQTSVEELKLQDFDRKSLEYTEKVFTLLMKELNLSLNTINSLDSLVKSNNDNIGIKT